MVTTVVAFIIILGVLIFVHELGHFITAKRAGLTVEEFGFGFPPRMLSFKRGETRYSINWIPFGGFVKILGEGGEEHENHKSFANRGVGTRALVVAAGIIMNYVLAIVLLSIVNMSGIATAVEGGSPHVSGGQVGPVQVTVTVVESDSPASQADLHPGDEIKRVAGEPVSSVNGTVSAITSRTGKAVPVDVQRGDKTFTTNVTPRVNPPDGQGPLGIQLVATAKVKYPWYRAIYEAGKEVGLLTGQIVIVFARLVARLFTTGTVGNDVAGPIGIAKITGQILQLGFIPLLQFTAVLSVNLGIVNAIPFPALDGGRLLFLVIEKIRRKKVSKRVENTLHTVGFGILIVLILLVTVRDITRLF